MEHEWEKDLGAYATKKNVEKLRETVNNRIEKGKTIKWSVIIIDLIFVAILAVLIGLLNVLNKGMDLRLSLINGIIAFELAIITFFKPIKGSSITQKEVDCIIGKQVTGDIMGKVRETVEQKTSGIEKWFAVIGACGIFATVILKFTN